MTFVSVACVYSDSLVSFRLAAGIMLRWMDSYKSGDCSEPVLGLDLMCLEYMDSVKGTGGKAVHSFPIYNYD